MEELASVINNFARLILYAGGGVFTIAVCVAGFFYMTAFGDPQKQNIARGALVGAFVGVCIMGVSFLAPRIMSQFVLEPAGLEGVANSGNTGCDRTLRSALITQRGVGNGKQVNSMVRAIQAQRANDCNQEIWNPFVHIAGTPPGATGTPVPNSGFQDGPTTCMPGTAGTDHMIGQTDLPTTLESLGSDSRPWRVLMVVLHGMLQGTFWLSFPRIIDRLMAQSAGSTLLSPTTGTRRARA